ncbi:hypothetical protein H4Q26_005170 [Puccinia striiformis f. sp. tritici PST-130]|nr:hypothetical protein H4Q26_005170 [Puccinia striiformis f. sp. tritici PST-130]
MNSYHRCSSGEAWMLRADTKPPPLPPGTNIAVSRFDLLFQKQLSGLKSAVKRFITSGPSQPSASLTHSKQTRSLKNQSKTSRKLPVNISKPPQQRHRVGIFKKTRFLAFILSSQVPNSKPPGSVNNQPKITKKDTIHTLLAPSTAPPC